MASKDALPHVIEFLAVTKAGRWWLRAAKVYADRAEALAVVDLDMAKERAAHLTPIIRRVVEA